MKPEPSNVWRGIVNAREWILKGICFQVGDVSNINIWNDSWVPGLAERVPRPREWVFSKVISKVADLKDGDGVGWNVELVKSLFTEEVANYILNVSWSNFVCKDKLLWQGIRVCGFSVGRCLEMNKTSSVGAIDVVWEKLWKFNIHARLNIFMWRMLAGVLLSRDVIVHRIGAGEASCAICGAKMKSLFHLFKECPEARALAFACKMEFLAGKLEC